ncbi:MAG: O-antigen ligase family protein [bacterium]|nr:O-antigen ligase family protein [bacterium]
MKEAYTQTLNLIIRYYLVALAFITPLFFLTFTSEAFNFNKYILLVGSASILTLLWTGKMLLEGRVRVVRTALDIPILIFLAVSLLSTVFSVDQVISLAGWYPRFHFSFLSILSYSLLYFVAVSNLDKETRRLLLWAVVASGLVLGFLSTASFFGQYLLPQAYTKARNWTPIGSINQLVLYLVVSLPIAFSLLFSEKNYFLKAAAALAIFFMSLAFIFSNMGVGWIGLAVAGAAFLVLSPKLILEPTDRWLAGGLVAIFVVVALVFASGSLRNTLLKPMVKGKPASLELVKENTLPLANSWKVAARATGEKPLLGSGPGTYLFNFTAFKPFEMNSTSNWNIRFDESGSDYLGILPTMGIIGLIAFSLIVLAAVRPTIKYVLNSPNLKQNSESLFLAVSIVVFSLCLVFFNSGIATFLVFLLITAAAFSLLRDAGVAGVDDVDLRLVALRSGGIIQVEPAGRPKQNSLALVSFIPAIFVFLALVFVGYRVYAGEVYFRRAVNEANQKPANGKNIRDNLLASIRSNSYFDLYHRTLMLTDLSLAKSISQRGKLTKDEQNTLVGLIGEAQNEGKIASGYETRGLGVITIKKVPGTSNLNVANWESLALIYSNIGGDQRANALIHAKNTYIRAIQLDPLNPQLYQSLATLYYSEKDYENAIKLLQSATQAKADYLPARYDLAQAFIAKGGVDSLNQAVNELGAYLEILPGNQVPTGYPKKEEAQKLLDEIKKKAQEASKSAAPKQ